MQNLNITLDNGVTIKGTQKRASGYQSYIQLVIECPRGFILGHNSVTIRKNMNADMLTKKYVDGLVKIFKDYRVDTLKDEKQFKALRQVLDVKMPVLVARAAD